MADKSKAIMAKFVLCLQPYKQLPFWSMVIKCVFVAVVFSADNADSV